MEIKATPRAWEQAQKLGLDKSDLIAAVDGAGVGVWLDDETERLYTTVRGVEYRIIVKHRLWGQLIISVRR